MIFNKLLAGIATHAQMLQPDSLNNKANKPQVRIRVKKVYDKNENIIRAKISASGHFPLLLLRAWKYPLI